MKKQRLFLLIILVLAFLLRFYRLGNYPALNADEAAIGYNAYSLLETGQDEHGNSWPIHFQSFNDFKPGFYFYLVMPFVKVLGLNEWAVRIPGALAGVLTVWVVYLLVLELFSNKKHALLAALFLAISPWHIHFSRGGWEVNVATFLMALAVYLFVCAKKQTRCYIFSVMAFAASLYTYHAVRAAIPLLGLGLVVTNWRIFLKNSKTVLVSGLIGVVLVLPLIREIFGPEVISRAAGVGLFADTGPLARIEEQRGEHDDFTGLIPKVLHNKLTNYGLAFAENWGDHYWGEFLFLSGDEIQRNKVPETGQMYLIEFLFLAMALIGIAKKPSGWGIVLWWLVVAPVAAALTFQSPHALRAHNMIIPLTIISSFGALKFIELFKNKKTGVVIFGAIMLWSFVRYQRMYWIHMAKEYPYSSQYGVKELTDYVSQKGGEFEKVIVTNRYDQPYILFLFYLKYPPSKFQAEHVLTEPDEYGFSTVEHFGKYVFEKIDYDKVKPENPNSLIVGTDEDIPDAANIVKKIYGSNGYKYFEVVAN